MVYTKQIIMAEQLSENGKQIYEQLKAEEGGAETACESAPTDEMKSKCDVCMKEDDKELCVAKLIDSFTT